MRQRKRSSRRTLCTWLDFAAAVVTIFGSPRLSQSAKLSEEQSSRNPYGAVYRAHIRFIIPTRIRENVRSKADMFDLTDRQREIVQLLAEGKSSKEVASALGLSVKTAETHRANIMRRLDCHSVTALVRYAIRNHIIEIDRNPSQYLTKLLFCGGRYRPPEPSKCSR